MLMACVLCVSCDGSVKGVWGVLSKDGAVLQVGPRLVSVLSGAAACVGGFAVLCRWGWCPIWRLICVVARAPAFKSGRGEGSLAARRFARGCWRTESTGSRMHTPTTSCALCRSAPVSVSAPTCHLSRRQTRHHLSCVSPPPPSRSPSPFLPPRLAYAQWQQNNNTRRPRLRHDAAELRVAGGGAGRGC